MQSVWIELIAFMPVIQKIVVKQRAANQIPCVAANLELISNIETRLCDIN